MLRKSIAFFVVGVVAVAVAASSASAAAVTYTLVLDPNVAGNGCVGCTLTGAGTWDLYASASAGDNFGIAGYQVTLANTLTTLHRSPQSALTTDPEGAAPEPAPAGFKLLRSGNNAQPLTGSQDTVTDGVGTPYIIHGLGQTASSFIGQYPGTFQFAPNAQNTAAGWAANLLLAEGTYTAGGTLPAFGAVAGTTIANVFTAATGVATAAADVTMTVVPPPGGGTLPVVGDLNLSTTSLNQTIGGTVSPLTDVDTLSFVNVAAPVFTPLLPGKPLLIGIPPTLNNAGEFSWNTQGSHRGTYVWAINGTNEEGSDGGSISVQVNFVPEPATFALFGLGLVGLVGFARRRD